MSTSPRPQKRTAHTCVTCRARKVRCDGRRGICANCERLGFGCSYDESVGVEVGSPTSSTFPPPNSNAGGTINVPRRRVRQACLSCHAKKARCSGATPRCDRCRAQGLECVYRPGKRSMALPSLSLGSGTREDGGGDVVMGEEEQGENSSFDVTRASTTSVGSPAAEAPEPEGGIDALAVRTFDTYFRVVHHIPGFSFLHRASLMERHNSPGGLDRCLLLAMVGVTSLMKDMGPGIRDYGDRCIDSAEAICTSDLEKPSIITLQALILVIKHRILSRRVPAAFMLFALASRLASALRLNHENPSLCFLARESRRRLMWAMYLIDAAMANGQPDFALWTDAEHRIHVQLPCNERNFEFDLPEATEMLRPPAPGSPFPDDLGFLALHTRVHWMHARILEYSAKLMGKPSPEEIAYIPAACAGMVGELDAFDTRLPVSFRWSEGNVRLRTYSPRLTVYIMTHVWSRQCLLSLHRLFLPGLKDALPPSVLNQLDARFVTRSRHQCYEHARAMADMFAQMLALDNGVPTTDLDLPSCALQCTRVLYHARQTAGEEMGFSMERVREMAGVCLRVAQTATPGEACAAIQRDIEKIIATGLPLAPTETPASLPVRAAETGSSGSMAYMTPTGPVATTTAPENNNEVLIPAGLPYPDPMPQMAPPITPDLLGGMAQVPLPADLQGAAGLVGLSVAAPSQATEKTSGSDAFEGALYDMNFGQDFFGGADALLAFSNANMNVPGGPDWFGLNPNAGPTWTGGGA